MKKKGLKQKGRVNLTVNRRAMADPKVKLLINELQSGWDRIGSVERGDRLRALVSLGCSTRGLGKELKQSATNIRRHIALRSLPAADCKAVRAEVPQRRFLSRRQRLTDRDDNKVAS